MKLESPYTSKDVTAAAMTKILLVIKNEKTKNINIFGCVHHVFRQNIRMALIGASIKFKKNLEKLKIFTKKLVQSFFR